MRLFSFWTVKKRDSCLLGGERKGNIIPGFYLGNSPLDYSEEKLPERRLS
jgi:phosphosulfolactate phosphohydrolase-like enzyme